jgi:hypothetical protein
MNDEQPNKQIQNRLLWTEAILVVACFPLLLEALQVITLSTAIRWRLFVVLAVAIAVRIRRLMLRRRSI